MGKRKSAGVPATRCRGVTLHNAHKMKVRVQISIDEVCGFLPSSSSFTPTFFHFIQDVTLTTCDGEKGKREFSGTPRTPAGALRPLHSRYFASACQGADVVIG